MVFRGQDAWRKHPLLAGAYKAPFPGLKMATGIFAAYLVIDTLFCKFGALEQQRKSPRKLSVFARLTRCVVSCFAVVACSIRCVLGFGCAANGPQRRLDPATTTTATATATRATSTARTGCSSTSSRRRIRCRG